MMDHPRIFGTISPICDGEKVVSDTISRGFLNPSFVFSFPRPASLAPVPLKKKKEYWPSGSRLVSESGSVTTEASSLPGLGSVLTESLCRFNRLFGSLMAIFLFILVKEAFEKKGARDIVITVRSLGMTFQVTFVNK